MGVIWFVFFMFSNLYRLDLHNKTRVALANQRWNIYKKTDWKLDLPYLVMIIEKRMFVVFLSWKHKSSQLCTLLSVDQFLVFQNVILISLKHVSLQCLLFNPHQNHIPIKIYSLIKETSHLRPIYGKLKVFYPQKWHMLPCDWWALEMQCNY